MKLLADNGESMERVLTTELPDVTHPDLHWHLDPDELERLASFGDEAPAKRAELFRVATAHGLTGRDVAVALLRPYAQLIRPTLGLGECGCRRCS